MILKRACPSWIGAQQQQVKSLNRSKQHFFVIKRT